MLIWWCSVQDQSKAHHWLLMPNSYIHWINILSIFYWSIETTTMSNSKKQTDDLSSNLNRNEYLFDEEKKMTIFFFKSNQIFIDLPWGLPLAFPSMPSFGSFPPLGLPTSNFPMLNSFNPLALSSVISNDSNNGTSAVSSWPTGLNNFDYNEYTKQLALLMNVFHEQKTPQIDQSNGKTSSSSSSKSKRANNPENHSSSSLHGKNSSSSNSNKTSTSRSKQSKTSTNSDSKTLDTLSFPSATSVSNSNPTFPFFLPPLLSQTSSTTTGTNNNLSSMTYPFSNLSSSLLNPAASLYPFLSPDWFSSSTLMDTFTGLSSQNSHGQWISLFVFNSIKIKFFQIQVNRHHNRQQ